MDKMSIEERIEKLLKALNNRKVEDAILTLYKSKVTYIRYANNEITIPIINNESLLSVYIGLNKRRLTTQINDLYFDPERLAEKLVKIIGQLEEQEVYVNLPKQKFEYREIAEVDEETIKFEEEGLPFVEKIINESLNEGAKRTAGTLRSSCTEIKSWTSNGLYLEDKRSEVMLNHRCFLDSSSTGQWSFTARSVKELNWKLVVDKAIKYCKLNVNHKKVEAGRYKAILAPMIFASLMEHVAYASSAYSVETGYSFLAGKLGKKIGSEVLTLIDDPSNKEFAGYARFDEECIPTKRKEIIKEGILQTYLHNLTTAKKFNTETTGNAGIVSPMPFSIHVKPGEMEEEEMIKEIDKGLLIVNNWYLRFQNYQLGDFSTILRDGIFLIEKGEIKQALIGARLSDNFINIMQNIKGLSKLVYPIRWWEVNTPTYAPYALIENINITTAE